jgi:hypothetical protein
MHVLHAAEWVAQGCAVDLGLLADGAVAVCSQTYSVPGFRFGVRFRLWVGVVWQEGLCVRVCTEGSAGVDSVAALMIDCRLRTEYKCALLGLCVTIVLSVCVQAVSDSFYVHQMYHTG